MLFGSDGVVIGGASVSELLNLGIKMEDNNTNPVAAKIKVKNFLFMVFSLSGISFGKLRTSFDSP